MPVGGDDMLRVAADFGVIFRCTMDVDLRRRRDGFTIRKFSEIGGREDCQFD